MSMILGCSPQHRRTTDIDEFHELLHWQAFSRFLEEGIEIHHNDIDGIDALFGHDFQMAFVIPATQQSSVDLRMKGFYPTVQDFFSPRVFGDFGHIHALFTQGFISSSRG